MGKKTSLFGLYNIQSSSTGHTNRPAGEVQGVVKMDGSGRVGSGRIGSDQAVFKVSRIGPSRHPDPTENPSRRGGLFPLRPLEKPMLTVSF